MVWARIQQHYHGDNTVMWQKFKDKKAAKAEVRNWNAFKNPYDYLELKGFTADRPSSGVRKNAYGVWIEDKKKLKEVV
jgi:hypothetical protein